MVRNPVELIFSGGNFKTFSFLGSVQALLDSGELDINKVERFIGTSGGSVISFLLSIDYEPRRIMNIMKQIPFSKLSPVTSEKWLYFFDNYGLHDTKRFRDIFEILLVHQGWSPNTTFIEFYEKTKKELVFTSFCLNTSSLAVLDHENTPELKLLDALCMSIAVPFIFYPVSYQNRLYVDAFFIDNHPVDLTLCKHCDKSISFCLSSSKVYHEKIELLDYIRILMDSPVTKLQEMCLQGYKGETIVIPCEYDFEASFDVNTEVLETFYETGFRTVRERKESEIEEKGSEIEENGSEIEEKGSETEEKESGYEDEENEQEDEDI